MLQAEDGSLNVQTTTLKKSPARSPKYSTMAKKLRKRTSFVINHSLGHSFSKKTYKKPTYCQHCSDLLWGFINQGLCCEICGFVSHEKCTEHILTVCDSKAIESIEDPQPHQFRLQKAKKHYSCTVCRLRLDSSISVCCQVCGDWAHAECQPQALDNCKSCATFLQSTIQDKHQAVHAHGWREGNLSSKATCACCNKPCYSKHCLFGWMCSWCGISAHPDCREKIPPGCDFADLKNLILPPYAVRFESSNEHERERENRLQAHIRRQRYLESDMTVRGDGVDLYIHEGTSDVYSRQHVKITAQGNMSIGLVIEIALQEHHIFDSPDSYFLELVTYELTPLQSKAERRRSSANFLGAFSARDMTFQKGKTLCFSDSGSTGSSSKLEVKPPLEKHSSTLSNFSDSARSVQSVNIWTCDRCFESAETVVQTCPRCNLPNHSVMSETKLSQRVVQPTERVSFLFETATAPDVHQRLYLRCRNHAKEVSQGKGVIRVFAGVELNATAKYKTVAVEADQTSADVIKVLHKKFKLDIPLDSLVLQQVEMKKASARRTLSSNEHPLEVKFEYNERRLNPNMLRFYLRDENAIGDLHTTIYVSNLPKKLSEKEIEVKLLDIMDCFEDDVTFDVILPRYGCAVVQFNSSGTGKVALEHLKGAKIFNKNIKARLMPVIQPEEVPVDSLPLLVFVNGKSGGGQGREIVSRLSTMMNSLQVFDVTGQGPMFGLCVFRKLVKYQILVAGGDGTVGWVLNAVQDIVDAGFNAFECPPVSILPVGTGNDLSRILNWGGGYTGERLRPLVVDIPGSDIVMMDRWMVTCSSADGKREMAMTNYFGIGIDAQIALDFHQHREEHPEKFSSRTRNKGHYIMSGMNSMVKKPCKRLPKHVVMLGDGQPIRLPNDFEGIVVLNISSFAAGSDPWGTDKDEKYRPQSFSDGYLEVVGVYGVMHLSHISAKLRTGKRIGQFKKIEFQLQKSLPVQIDGEPWKQSSGIISIEACARQCAMRQRKRKKYKNSEVKEAEPYLRQVLASTMRQRSMTCVPPKVRRERSGSLSEDVLSEALGRVRITQQKRESQCLEFGNVEKKQPLYAIVADALSIPEYIEDGSDSDRDLSDSDDAGDDQDDDITEGDPEDMTTVTGEYDNLGLDSQMDLES